MVMTKKKVSGENKNPVVYIMLGEAGKSYGRDERIVEVGRRQGWRMIDLNLFDKGELPPDIVPEGAIIAHPPYWPSKLPSRNLGYPVVQVGSSPTPHEIDTPSVFEDMNAAGCLAAEHFAERGFRHVGFLGYAPGDDNKPLIDSLTSRASELGMEGRFLGLPRFSRKDDVSIRFEKKRRIRNRQIAELLRDAPKPMGLLTFNDRMAARICTICQLNGLSVPDEVAILGHGNSAIICESAPVRLSSIQIVGKEFADAVAKLLQHLMDGGTAPTSPVMIAPKGIIVRESTDVFEAGDVAAAQAVRYLWQNCHRNIGVSDVANELGISRRSLEYRFRKAVGRSLNEELRRRRLERCANLLETTELPVAEIVKMVGFSSESYLYAAFRHAYGMTPKSYRRMKTHR